MSTRVLSSPKSVERSQSGCRFCQRLSDSDSWREDWTVVAETEHLVAVPSVGPLVLGWLLILPKGHHLNFADAVRMNPCIEQELEKLATDWEDLFGSLTWFEHGPRDVGSDVGCSIDHAHLHLVPLGELNLIHAARNQLEGLHFKAVRGLGDTRSAVDRGYSYLYVKLSDGTHWLAESNRIPSQSLRRVIATEQGRGEEWDWKQFPRDDLLRETINQATSLR